MNSEKNNNPLIVTAAVIKENGRYLVTQRMEDDTFSLLWEFPGGKLKSGESPEDGLIRECTEELDCGIVVLGINEVVYHSYENFNVLLLFYNCRIIDGNPKLAGVNDLKWLKPSELNTEIFLPADREFIKRLRTQI